MNVPNYNAAINPGIWVAIFGVALAVAAFLLWRLVRCKNSLSWEDLVSTNGVLNAYKIGYWIGVGFSSWVIVKQCYLGQLDASLLAVYLGFLGGVPISMSAISSRSPSPVGRPRHITDDDNLPPVPPPTARIE